VIFVTVGMQLGFDRLVRAIDEIAPILGEEVIAQIGDGEYVPQNISYQRHFSPEEISAHFEESRMIVGHAGVGTILAAQRHAKPLVLLPRNASLGEHRNDHQLATARQLQGRPGIEIAFEIEELPAAIARTATLTPTNMAASPELEKLKQTIAIFIENGSLAR